MRPPAAERRGGGSKDEGSRSSEMGRGECATCGCCFSPLKTLVYCMEKGRVSGPGGRIWKRGSGTYGLVAEAVTADALGLVPHALLANALVFLLDGVHGGDWMLFRWEDGKGQVLAFFQVGSLNSVVGGLLLHNPFGNGIWPRKSLGRSPLVT